MATKKTKEVKLKAVKKTVKKAKGAYTLEVSVNDVEYKGSGATMVDALSSFVASPVFPFGVKTRVFLKFSDGKNEATQLYRPIVARRVFSAMSRKPSALEILARKLEARLA